MTDNSTSKTNLIIIVIGILFMFLLLYHVFGSTSQGIYSIATVKNVQSIES